MTSLTRPLGERGSLTARLVAAGRGLGHDDDHDPLAAVALGGRLGRAVAAARGGGPAGAALRLVGGGLARHATLRMLAVDAAVTSALSPPPPAPPADQVVVVGAGYDTRPWRLPAAAGTTWHELDLPGTQAGKRERLAHVPALPDELHLHPVDLAADGLAAALATAGVDTSRPTVWLWEAVAMYLPRDVVAATLADVGAASVPGSVLVMTHLFPPVLPLPGGVRAPALDAVARRAFGIVGEPLRSTWSPDRAAADLAAIGYVPVARTRSGDWARAHGHGTRPSTFDAEHLVVARRPGPDA